MSVLNDENFDRALENLQKQRDAALSAAIIEAYRLLTMARWSGETVPAELEIENQMESIISAIPFRNEADKETVRQDLTKRFATLEEVYGDAA